MKLFLLPSTFISHHANSASVPLDADFFRLIDIFEYALGTDDQKVRY